MVLDEGRRYLVASGHWLTIALLKDTIQPNHCSGLTLYVSRKGRQQKGHQPCRETELACESAQSASWFTHHQVGNDDGAQEERHAGGVAHLQTVPHGLDPLSAQHAEHNHDAVHEVCEIPPRHFPGWEELLAFCRSGAQRSQVTHTRSRGECKTLV